MGELRKANLHDEEGSFPDLEFGHVDILDWGPAWRCGSMSALEAGGPWFESPPHHPTSESTEVTTSFFITYHCHFYNYSICINVIKRHLAGFDEKTRL